MSRTTVTAFAAAGLLSAIALFDAIHRGVTGVNSQFSDQYGVTTIYLLAPASHGVIYLIFAWILHSRRHHIDSGGRVRKSARLTLMAALVALAAVMLTEVPRAFLTRNTDLPPAAEMVAGIAFGLMFLSSFVLGVTMRHLPGLRPAAWTLIAQLPLVGLVTLLGAFGSPFAHPAYIEVANAIGIALIARVQPRRPVDIHPVPVTL